MFLGDAAAVGDLVAGLNSPGPELSQVLSAAAFAAAGRPAGTGAGGAQGGGTPDGDGSTVALGLATPLEGATGAD